MRLIVAPVIAGNAFRERFENPVSIKSLLLFGAIIALFVALAMVLKIARNKSEEKRAQNIVEFYGDEVLETKKLERTLSVALIAVAVVAVSITAYFLWEPTRQAEMTTSFDQRSVRRGQTLFASVGMKGYNNVQSLGCANCHGGYDAETGRYASGGAATYTLKSLYDPETDAKCKGDNKFTNKDCITTSVSWKAPPLNTVLYKYPIRKSEPDNPFVSSCRLSEQRSTPDCRSHLYDIITYGRPGTPMPAWGVAGGGPKNEQAVQDLVNFLASIQLPKDQAAQPLRSGEIIKQKKKISDARKALNAAIEKVVASGVSEDGAKQDVSVVKAQEALDVEKAALKAIEAKTENDYIREAQIAEAQQAVDAAQKVLDEEAPAAVAKAQDDFNQAENAYKNESALSAFSDPQKYLEKLEKDQVEIKIEKKVEEAKAKKNKTAETNADLQLQETRRLKEIAQNYVEAKDALATANATKKVFAPEALKNAKDRLTQVQNQSEGQMLFEYNCARCHTKGWSYFNPSNARIPLPAPQGTGAYGPNLSGGDVIRQFPNEKDQINFIGSGSIFQSQYGSRGVGSGRMPGYNTNPGALLSEEQIKAIVDYERNDLKDGK
ncbi:MAG: hypothetical protein U0R17_03855 [Acidimicrobiia bacterium]